MIIDILSYLLKLLFVFYLVISQNYKLLTNNIIVFGDIVSEKTIYHIILCCNFEV